jgi:hypothetical protein
MRDEIDMRMRSLRLERMSLDGSERPSEQQEMHSPELNESIPLKHLSEAQRNPFRTSESSSLEDPRSFDRIFEASGSEERRERDDPSIAEDPTIAETTNPPMSSSSTRYRENP